MTTTVDSRYQALGLLGHQGAASDRIRDWLLSQLPPSAEGNNISDLWARLFDEAGVPPGARGDRMLAWLRQNGVDSNTLADGNFIFWSDALARAAMLDSPL